MSNFLEVIGLSNNRPVICHLKLNITSDNIFLDSDFLCKNYILNGLSDELYDYYLS